MESSKPPHIRTIPIKITDGEEPVHFSDMVYQMLNGFARKNQTRILEWIEEKYTNKFPQIYSSVDLRNAGFKIAHVDANLFPAGFNTLSPEGRSNAAKILSLHLEKIGSIKQALIVAEEATRNFKYFENLLALVDIFAQAGIEAKIGSLERKEKFNFAASQEVVVFPIIRQGNQLKLTSFTPEFILLNNDLSNGLPALLEDVEQPIMPSGKLGWHSRSKFTHFQAYQEVIQQFAKEFKFDPWLLSTYQMRCNNVNFRQDIGLDQVALAVDRVIALIREKYFEYGIKHKPYVFVKADRGTYGMGVMAVRAGEDLVEINKKQRHTMDVIKGGVRNSTVIVQEGIPTLEKHHGKTSETVAYMVAGKVAELVSRIHGEKDPYNNLNSRGMEFVPKLAPDFGIYHVVAMLAALAINKEEDQIYSRN
jgi:glutamate--cysteine ligase